MKFRYHLNNDKEKKIIFVRIMYAICFLNMIDLLITVLGVSYFGMVEANPLFYSMSGGTILLFIIVKTLISFFCLFIIRSANTMYDTKNILGYFNHYFGFFVIFVYCMIISMNLTTILFP